MGNQSEPEGETYVMWRLSGSHVPRMLITGITLYFISPIALTGLLIHIFDPGVGAGVTTGLDVADSRWHRE